MARQQNLDVLLTPFAVTARWVADTVGIERRPVHQRLEELHEGGELERGKLSPRVVIWWVPVE